MVRTAHQHPANGDRIKTTPIPKATISGNLNHFQFAAIPGHDEFGPEGGGVIEPMGQVGLPSALLRFGAGFALGLGTGPVVQDRIKPEARDQFDRYVEPLAALDQRYGGIAAIADQGNLPVRLPAAYFINQKTSPFNHSAMPFVQFTIGFGR